MQVLFISKTKVIKRVNLILIKIKLRTESAKPFAQMPKDK